MYADEMTYKPEETKLLSEDGGMLSADDIATSIINCINNW